MRKWLGGFILFLLITSAGTRHTYSAVAASDSTEIAVVYDFTENDRCPTTDDGINQPVYGLRFSDFTRHGVECEDGENVFNSNQWQEGDSVGFSVTPDRGYELVFRDQDSLSFWAERSAAGPTDFRLTYRVGDGETHVVESWGLSGHETDIVIYGADLPELVTTEEVTFAIEATRDASHWRGNMLFDDVRVQLAVREHASATSIASVRERPLEYRLLQNYPNPFNPSTTIPLQLPAAAHVRLTVHNVLGRRIQVLKDERMPAGDHRIRFDGENLTGGTYFVRVEAGEFEETQPMTLLK